MSTFSLLLFCFSVTVTQCVPLPTTYCIESYLRHPAVKKFREYLQIDTSREENIQHAVNFWRRQAFELGLEFSEHRPAGKPICVLTWPGSDPSQPSIMLNSHMDVVGVDPDDWIYPPFSAHLDEQGDIYSRGAQDDKDVAIQYIEAIRKMKEDNVTLERTLHVTLMPDEETGGFHGMIPFLDTEEFKAMNVGFALDEGLVSTDGSFYITYLDKRPWQMNFTVHGMSAHGSTMPDDSAMVKLQTLIDAIYAYRKTQESIADAEDHIYNGTYNTLNINVIHGGLAANIVPSKMSLIVDMRLSMYANITEIEELVNSWQLASGAHELEFIRRIDESLPTAYDDSNPYWVAIQNAMKDMNLELKPILCPATTDILYLRSRGIPAFGFSTKTYTTSKVHSANEYLNVETFLRGIDIYVGILKRLGNETSIKRTESRYATTP